ncbi:MAG: diaminopimelate epimerase [Acidimicrobiales bacterium]
MTSDRGQTLALTKYEGAGNDFLVLVDPERGCSVDAGMVRALCRRHRGVGADGLIRVGGRHGGADVSMELWNADGSVAEMSGNGIRCLVQAAVDAGLASPPEITVSTAAGVRTVTYRPGGPVEGGTGNEHPADAAGDGWASVDMGPVRLGAERPQRAPGLLAREVDAGNPHVVLYGPVHPDELAVAEIGARIEAETPGGVNVEFVAPGASADELVLRVWERGVGETMACGTGSCAAAAAARSWGLVGDRVLVHNPGGTLEVRLGTRPGDPVFLAGPVRRVARVTVERSWLDRAGLDRVAPAGAR